MRCTRWLIIPLLLPVACAPPASQGDFDSPNPAARLYAIQRAGEQRDASSIPRLVESLNSDDPAVRMFAVQSLERITGERLGYNPYASLADRDAAVERWVAAAKTGAFQPTHQQE
jgi:HEAT repeat protein